MPTFSQIGYLQERENLGEKKRERKAIHLMITLYDHDLLLFSTWSMTS